MKILAKLYCAVAFAYLVAWLASLDLLECVGVLLLLVAVAAGLWAVVSYCRRAQAQRDRIEEKLDELRNKEGDSQ